MVNQKNIDEINTTARTIIKNIVQCVDYYEHYRPYYSKENLRDAEEGIKELRSLINRKYLRVSI